ncbi:unnamed protein product, partial [marine sediment metagenome]
DASQPLRLAYDDALAQDEVLKWSGKLTLKENDIIRFYIDACLDNDVIKCGVWGYMMKVPE